MRNLRYLLPPRSKGLECLGRPASHQNAVRCREGERAYPETTSLETAPRLVSSRCAALHGLGGGAGPPRCGGAGKGTQPADPAPAADSTFIPPLAPQLRLAFRVEQLIVVGPFGRPRDVPRHCCAIAGTRMDASCRRTRTAIAITLIAIASEWVKAPAETVATLKTLRSKMGTLPHGLTEKNKALLRTFDDPRLLTALLQLPDRLWHAARRALRRTGHLSTCRLPWRSTFSSMCRCECKI